MVFRGSIDGTEEAEESGAEKKMASESSIFSSILADIEENPWISQQTHKNFCPEFSIFSAIVADNDGENPTIQKKKLKKPRRSRGSTKTPTDFTCTVSQTLTHSDLVDMLNQELKILKSKIEANGDRFASPNPNYNRACDCVKEGKAEQREEEVNFLVYEVTEQISKGVSKSEDSVCKQEDDDFLDSFDEMLSTMLGDEEVNNAECCCEGDEFIEEMLEKIEKDRNYLERIREDYMFGGLLEELLRGRLREKAEKEEKEISSWFTNGEPQGQTEVAAGEKSEAKGDTKKESPVKVKLERCEQESTVTKRDYFGYKRRLYLIEKLRERDENLMKRRVKAARFGVEFSYMFLIPNELLVSEIENYLICLRRCEVNEDDKGTNVIIGKLEEVIEIVIRKKEDMEHRNVNFPESGFSFADSIPLCADSIQILGKIVWSLRRSNQTERLKFSDLDSLFEDCQKVLTKIELKLAETKQQIYRLVSADYESFSNSERFDSLLRRKLMKRFNVDNRFGRPVIGSYLVEIWKSLFQAEALQVQIKEE